MVSIRNAKVFCTLIVLLLVNARRGQGIWCSTCHAYSADDACITNPPPSHNCHRESNCIVAAKYRLEGTRRGELYSFTRSCSPLALPDDCRTGLDKATMVPLELCYTTCGTDGCNGFITLHHILDLLRRK